jgi:rubrerythrin
MAMKLIKEGKKPGPWFLGYWECETCKAIIEVEEADDEKVRRSEAFPNIMFLYQCPSCHIPQGPFARVSTSKLATIRIGERLSNE